PLREPKHSGEDDDGAQDGTGKAERPEQGEIAKGGDPGEGDGDEAVDGGDTGGGEGHADLADGAVGSADAVEPLAAEIVKVREVVDAVVDAQARQQRPHDGGEGCEAG